MSSVLVPLSIESEALPESSRFDESRLAVLNGVTAKNSKHNYALALDELAGFCQERRQAISLSLLLAFRDAMLERKLGEARRAGVITGEEAAQMTDVANRERRWKHAGGARKNDLMESHDLEDFVAGIDGRSTIVTETAQAPSEFRKYLARRHEACYKILVF